MKEEIPEHCPGPESQDAGKTDSCQGCPNQEICATQAKGPDPDLPLIAERLQSATHKVLVLSGKGGVGKSTVTSQLAFALSQEHPAKDIGVIDIDICGPSLPRMMGCQQESVHQSLNGWSPVYVRDNLSMISVGVMLSSQDDAVIWRGPKKTGMIKQFLKDVDWSDTLDVLLVDTPPGTSDEHLAVIQLMKEAGITGAVLVTTPQEVALQDVRKEIDFCHKAQVPILGVIENMSGFVCPRCHNESEIFLPTTGGARQLCQDLDIPLLASIPLDPRIGQTSDQGQPLPADSPVYKSYQKITNQII